MTDADRQQRTADLKRKLQASLRVEGLRERAKATQDEIDRLERDYD